MIYSMISTGTSTLAAPSVEIDMRDDDVLQSVQLLMWGTISALISNTNAPFEAQLSFLSTADFQTNDLNGLIAQQVAEPIGVDPVTPVSQYFVSAQIILPDVPVQGGERIYLHITGPLNVAYRVKASLFTKKTGRTVARRLR